MKKEMIRIKGARENNLKNIDLEVPRNQFVVFTGLSGSGKSSLAFDTIYAEGQRRYMESLSSYARQFLGQMEKPDVDSIEGLSPAISIDQKSTNRNPRSTVGTVTEIYDYFRLLYARVGIPHCPKCGKPISKQTVDQMVDRLMQLEERTRIQLLAPIVRGRKGEHAKVFQNAKKSGYVRVRVDGNVYDLSEDIPMEKNKKHNIEIVVDRLVVKPGIEKRLTDSIETTLNLADGLMMVDVIGGETLNFSQSFSCPDCDISIDEVEPRSFSFNNPFGACPVCHGLGYKMEFDVDLMIPDQKLSIAEGAIQVFGWQSSTDKKSYTRAILDALAREYHFDLETPFKDYPQEVKDVLLYGTGGREVKVYYKGQRGEGVYDVAFEGIIKNVGRRYREASQNMKTEYETFMTITPCDECHGQRLKQESLAVTVADKNIAEMCDMSVGEMVSFLETMELSERQKLIGEQVLKEIKARIGFLNDVGLDYLTLSRATGTLSGGEAQRIRLATQIGSGLVGVAYILDEPSIGLHQRDNDKLIRTLKNLRDLGNTLIVVEHDEDTMLAADYIVDIGPKAGEYGGEVVATGTAKQIMKNKKSITGAYLSGKIKIPVPKTRAVPTGWIKVVGAAENNLKNIDVDIPLGKIVGIAGVSGSGKSSLALGVLYAEGSRRYLEALSTYTRRRMTQAARASVDDVLYVPAALALHQRPGVPGIRSTFGTGTELLNSLRLMYSRLASHRCPNGHYLPPTLLVAAGKELTCPACGVHFYAPSAEELAFNSQGACPKCGGTGSVRTVDMASLVPDDSLTIDEGAVAPWNSLMWSLMTDVCREMGVRTDVPFRDLTEREKDIVYHGPAEKKHIFYHAKNSNQAGELDFTYFNAVYTVENALAKVKDEKGMKRVEKFLKEDVCPDCHGTRLSAAARAPKLRGISLDEACTMTLSELYDWVQGVPDSLPEEMRPMAGSICEAFTGTARRLLDLGLGYLTLDRSAATLSTGERQRMQLARAVRNRTTGVLYVLDEPSIGLHPANIVGLTGVMHDLVADGNSVILVDHDTQILKESDWIIEMGPEAGAKGGRVIAQGTVSAVAADPASQIGPFLSGAPEAPLRPRAGKADLFAHGTIRLSTSQIHTVKPLEVAIPKGRLTVVTGVSGSGKTTMVLESLIPALEAGIRGSALPPHVRAVSAEGIAHVKLIDATPIGINVRSTVATYAGVHDELRKLYARSPDAKARGCKAGDFSYNTGSLRCPGCDGTGVVSLDVQFLPDVSIPCPDCRGSRYARAAYDIQLTNRAGQSVSLPELMDMDVNTALPFCADRKTVSQKLQVLQQLGLGYLTLGEETPSLSGGEAQRLKLASEIGRIQTDSVFVFDEPSIGLHPLDVRVLLGVFQALLDRGATVVVIEHDLDVIRSADYVIDMGPGGGDAGGRIVAAGTPEEIRQDPGSITGRYL